MNIDLGRTFRVSFGASILAAITLLFALAAQAADTGGRFRTIDIGDAAVHMPPGLAGEARIKVVVIMSADPVAVVKSRAPNKELSEAERSSTAARVRAQHDGVVPMIEAIGGKVLARFEHAINGIKIEVDWRDLPRIASLPGVVSVLPVRTYEHTNAVSVPFIGAPLVWQGVPGFRGEGVKIAVIDTGIDYTHANFGGPGTVAAFNAAFATSTLAADPSLFGPGAPRVKGGTDLVGDAYDANDPTSVPMPDPNPLDCNGHGSHTAGTAAGSGVLASGATFTGPYDSAAYTPGAFKIGPGVAPKADIYAVRVFGCTGSTNVVTEAIDWAVQNDMDVISMSLGADFGVADSADALAARNAVRAGIIVVAASGNAGPAPYITSSPASGDGVIAAAAMDSTAGFPAATLALSSGPTITVQNSNNAVFPNGTLLPIVVLRTTTGAVSLGCSEAEYDKTKNGGIDVAGTLVVTMRGTCARVFRAGAGQKYGAAAVAMINSSPGYPPFEGAIPGGDPATNPFAPVTIPFFGVLLSDKTTLTGPLGGPAPASATENAAPSLPNPGFELVASFSSSGPRYGDSEQRPGISAPGVSIKSTLIGSGTEGVVESGTSMATPHVAGVGALVKQAKKTWPSQDQRASVLETALPSKLKDYLPRLEGAGVVDAVGAVSTQVVASGSEGDDEESSTGAADPLSFGFAELLEDFKSTHELKLHSHGKKAATFNVTVTQITGGPGVSVSVDPTVTVGADDETDLKVALKVPTTSVPATHPLGANNGYNDVSGVVTLTPAGGANNGVSLNLPYLLVPRVRSTVSGSLSQKLAPAHPVNTLTLTNPKGAIAGTPDFYSLGLTVKSPQDVLFADTRAVGAQTNPISATDSILVFAINTFTRMSNPAPNEFDILIDTTGAGDPVNHPNFAVVAADGSALIPGFPSGQMVVAVFNLTTGHGVIKFFADTATDNSTILLPCLASDLGLSPANASFTYAEQHFSGLDGSSATMPGIASFNAFAPSLTVSFAAGVVAPKASAQATVNINVAEWAKTPALGLMIVDQDNLAGKSQAQLIRVGSTGGGEGEGGGGGDH